MILAFEITAPVLTLGAITGMTYGILAVGLVLVYRSNRIINFAHGEIGAFGASLLGLAVVEWGVPYWVAFAGAVLASAAIGAGAEVAVVRRLKDAPNVMSIVATLGLAQVLLLSSLVINAQAQAGLAFPEPSFLPTFEVGALTITRASFAMLFLTPVLVAGLAVFLKRSRTGVAMRATAANAETARLSGMFAGRMSMLGWGIAGAVSAYTAILVRPNVGFISAEALGPELLLRALAAAVAARMRSLPVALGAGIVVGVVEQELLWNYPRSGFVEMMLFGVILAGLLAQRARTGRDEEKGSWAVVRPWRPLSGNLREVRAIRLLGPTLAVVALVAAVVLGLVVTPTAAFRLTVIMSVALVGLSVSVVTGLTGQLSLGQFALAGVGAVISYHVARETGNFALGFVGAGLGAGAVAVFLGVPALRLRGLMLAVATLSFALASSDWLLVQSWALDAGVAPSRPRVGSFTFSSSRSYYLMSLGVVAVGFLFARNVWQSGLGRRMRAVRDNEEGARAFTIRSTAVKLHAFALGGVLAGLGGALYGHSQAQLGANAFPVSASINVIAMTVLGGIGLLAGPIIGSLYIIGVPQFLPLDNVGLAATSLGWLVLVLAKPGGFAEVLSPLRDRLVAALARRAGVADAETTAAEGVATSMARAAPPDRQAPHRDKVDGGGVLLAATGLHKSYGGVRAVDGVSLEVRAGETVGLIGPNGAGKTTLFELLSGFTVPDDGHITFMGHDVTKLGPESRGRLGLIRSFQDASLFPTLTVLEAVELAQERTSPTSLARSTVGLRGGERAKERRARELVQVMGLTSYADKQISELSTGTRRIAELTCMLALEPNVLLLDEPSSGIAQRETEALGLLLRRLKEHLDVTLVIIEHDIPLIMGIADRLVAMESGRVLAEGPPDVVRNDPAVVVSYLGGDSIAIERSGAAGRCREVTRAGSRCTRRALPDGLCAQHRAILRRQV